tara:strand:+ start:1048 stop:2958 length:1911 start_codon:yes stop_codon:yes gene_type:complete
MANNQKLDISELDFDAIKSNLKTFLKNQDQFLDYDFEGSGMSALLDVLAYNTHYLSFHANMVANEMFIDSAALRSSVVSHAKTLGYEVRSVRSPKARVNVFLNDRSLPTATMNAGQVFTTKIDNVNYQFVTVSDFTASQVGSGLLFSDVPIYEGTYITTRYTVDSTDVNQKFILTSNLADTSTLTVKVQNSSTDSTTETYTKATDITQLTGTSAVYYLQEIDDGRFEVYFGDGVVSKALSDGNIVILQYVVTNIGEANGAFSFTASGAINTVTDIDTITIEDANGGLPAESIQSIKLSAPLDYAAQGRCVTTDDYKVFVKKLYANAENVQVFGGENGSFDPSLGVISTPEYGRVFISVSNTQGTNLSLEEKNSLIQALEPFKVASITPVIVDPDYTDVFLTVNFKFDSNLTTKTKDTLETEVTSTLTTYNTTELSKFDAVIRNSSLLRAIDDTDASITGSSAVPRLAKYFSPTLSSARDYNLFFNNALFNPHAGHNQELGGILTSSGFNIFGRTEEHFFDDDGNGNVRAYYVALGGDRVYTTPTIGTVNYVTGHVKISQINITGISDIDGESSTLIRIIVVPNSRDIVSLRNQILELDLINTTVTGVIDSIAVGDDSGGSSYAAPSASVSPSGAGY